jgi:hypothetical protein
MAAGIESSVLNKEEVKKILKMISSFLVKIN